MKKLLIIILVTSTTFCHIFAQTILSDTISIDSSLTKARSPYLIQDTFVVNENVVLTIDPGVEILFDSMSFFSSKGSIVARGTFNDSIFFKSSYPTSNNEIQWNGNGSVDLNYCHFISAPYPRLNSYSVFSMQTRGGIEIKNSTFNGDSVPGYGLILFIDSTSAHFQNSQFRGTRIQASTWDFPALNSIQFDSCEILNSYFAASNASYYHSRIASSKLDISGNSEVAYCLFDGERGGGIYIYSNYYLPLPYPNPLIISDTVNINHCDFRSNDSIYTSNTAREGALSFAYVARGFTNGSPTEYPILPALKFNQNIVCRSIIADALSLPLSCDMKDNCWCDVDTALILNRFRFYHTRPARDSLLNIITPFSTDCTPDEVFPGDANKDRTVNMLDLLQLGMRFGKTGPTRPNANITWTPQACPDWSTASQSGINDKHADCNGDGFINQNDTLAIFQNYGLRNYNYKLGSIGVPVTIRPTLPANSYKRGDTVIYRIDWGDMTTAVSNAYGVTLSLQYDTSQWNSSSLQVLIPNSWLGTPNTDMLTMVYHDSTNGRLDIGWARTDGMPRNGFGQIGSIVIVLDDDISKRGAPVSWDVLDAYAIDYQAESIDIAPDMETIFVDYATSVNPLPSLVLGVFPNPSGNGIFTLKTDYFPLQGKLTVVNIHGRDVYNKALNSTKKEEKINLQHLHPGTYILKYQMTHKVMVKKLVIR